MKLCYEAISQGGFPPVVEPLFVLVWLRVGVVVSHNSLLVVILIAICSNCRTPLATPARGVCCLLPLEADLAWKSRPETRARNGSWISRGLESTSAGIHSSQITSPCTASHWKSEQNLCSSSHADFHANWRDTCPCCFGCCSSHQSVQLLLRAKLDFCSEATPSNVSRLAILLLSLLLLSSSKRWPPDKQGNKSEGAEERKIQSRRIGDLARLPTLWPTLSGSRVDANNQQHMWS